MSVGTAIIACRTAGRGAALLAAVAGIAELQPHTASALPQAQPPLATPTGWHAHLFLIPRNLQHLAACASMPKKVCVTQDNVHPPMSSSEARALPVKV